jgi:hypothetical protein
MIEENSFIAPEIPETNADVSVWSLSNRANRQAAALADRHYTRQKVGARQFVPPGRCIVLLTENHDALWVSSYPYAQYVKHHWAGAWICSCFRNESAHLSSHLILQAVAVTRSIWGDPPALGMITFVDATKIQSVNPGYCYKKAGWQRVGRTKGGLLALQLLPRTMPAPLLASGIQRSLFSTDVKEDAQ